MITHDSGRWVLSHKMMSVYFTDAFMKGDTQNWEKHLFESIDRYIDSLLVRVEIDERKKSERATEVG